MLCFHCQGLLCNTSVAISPEGLTMIAGAADAASKIQLQNVQNSAFVSNLGASSYLKYKIVS
jgi:hypothetical protein